MQKYHINPETGRANICRAVKNCAFSKNGESIEHYDSKEEAQSAFEKQNSKKTINSIEKRTVIVPATEEEKSQKLDQKIDEMIDDLSHEERQKLLTHIAGLKRDEKKKEFNKKLDQLMVNEKYYGTVFHHRGKVVNPERIPKEEYHKLQEEKNRKRIKELRRKEAEDKAKKLKEEQEKVRRKNLHHSQAQKEKSIEDFENLTQQEEELKNDKKKVREYIRLLQRKSHAASAIERASIKIRDNSQKQNKYSAELGVEDAEMFEKETHQDEYRKLLELRAEMRKRIKRNPLTRIKKASADMRGVLIEEQSIIREINYRIGRIINRSYKWKIGKEKRDEWAQFEASIDHLLNDDEK